MGIALLALAVFALGALSLGAATASSSAPCVLKATTLRPTHVTSMSALLRGRETTCGAHRVTAWFIIDGSRGSSWDVLPGRRPRIETELLVNLVHGTHVTYRFVIQHGKQVVRGRLVKFTTP